MSLAETYRQKALDFFPDVEEVSDNFCAILLAKDLMVDSPEDFKVGYSRENAAIAACEIFSGADYDKILKSL